MERKFYIAYLIGNDVFANFCLIGVITSLTELDKVRNECRSRFNIEFSSDNSYKKGEGFYHVYNNITDKKDIKLIIEETFKL